MAKKMQDLKPDIVLKNYWNNNGQFADFFNAVLFAGEQVISADELEDVDTEESSVLEHRKYAESIKASVITVVVYYCDNPWDGAVTLHGMLNIPDKMKHFVNDYKMLLVEARKNNLILHNMTNITFFDMLSIVLDKNISKNEAREKVIEYALTHNVDKTVVMTVAGATNCKLDYNALFRKGDVTMCKLFDEIQKEGKAEGIAEGIVETGLDLGLTENDILQRLQNKLNVSLRKAQEYFEMFGRQVV